MAVTRPIGRVPCVDDPVETLPLPYSSEELAAIRAALPATEQHAYLNAGFLGPLPGRTRRVLELGLEREAGARSRSTFFEELVEQQAHLRALLADLTGSAPDRVALMHATHVALSTALWGLDALPGESIVTTDAEHPGLLGPLRMLQDRLGVEVRTVPFGEGGVELAERLAEACDGQTLAVAASHVCYLDGAELDLPALARLVPAGVRTIIDGAQGAGALPVELDAWGIDAYTVSGQKWPLGPSGTGALVLADPGAWRITVAGYMATTNPQEALTSSLCRDARRFEFAQESPAQAAALAESLRFLLEDVGLERSAAHVRRLNAYARELLGRHLDEPGQLVSLDGSAHLLRLGLADGVDARQLVHGLEAEHGVLVRDLPHGPAIRISIGAWTTAADLEQVTEGIAELLDWDR